MNCRWLMLVLACCFVSSAAAQKMSWKKHLKIAEEALEDGELERAAQHFQSAWEEKKSKPELAYRAGSCLLQLRDYRQAAATFAPIKDAEIKREPPVQLLYAQCLQQDANYAEAEAIYIAFAQNYQGPNQDRWRAQAQLAIEGCQLAQTNTVTSEVEVQILSSSINTVADEYAPLAFNDDLLYFSSTVDGHSKIFRSHLQNGSWTPAVLPRFPTYDDLHVGHGTFTPDNKRFYFTICESGSVDPVKAKCDLYVTVRENDEWSKPRKLRDYIKLGGTTASHPFVMHKRDQEILYFASDRKGGIGGMDIWYMTRHVDSEEYDFTLPVNLGASINTPYDEITPFYDAPEATLYFSSNGRAAWGGFDIFQARGELAKWEKVQNLGLPYNSSADDYYFALSPSKQSGFFSSNRRFEMSKISTRQNDLFYFTTPSQEVMVSGNIYDEQQNNLLKDVQIYLYEKKNNHQRRLLQSLIANNGTYQFALLPDREFIIEASKYGYTAVEYSFNTFEAQDAYGEPIYLKPSKSQPLVQKTETIFREEDSIASVEEAIGSSESKPEATTPDRYINAYFQGFEVTTTAPKHQGLYWKVQISTAERFDASDSQFNNIRQFGRIDTEYIAGKNWTRILLADYFSLREARDIMLKARELGFPEAFVVRYKNGNRL